MHASQSPAAWTIRSLFAPAHRPALGSTVGGRRILELLLCGWLAAASLLIGQEPVPRQDQLEDLILALDEATGPQEQQRIAERIKRLGKAALPGISQPPRGLSQRTELWLRQIRFEIEQSLNQQATQSTRINLVGRYTLAAALREMQQQTGTGFELAVDDTQPRDLEIRDTAFWPGLDQLLDQFKADIYRFSPPGTFKIIRGNRTIPRGKYASYPGILRIEPVQYSTTSNLANENQTSDRLALSVRWEPRVTPYQLEFDHAAVVVVDSAGTARPSQLTEKSSLTVAGNESAKTIEIRFDHIPREVTGIDSIRGKLLLKSLIGREKFRFPEVIQKKKQSLRKSEATVSVLDTSVEENQLKVSMQFQFDQPADALESHRGWMFRNQAYLVDDEAKQILPGKILTSTQETDKMGFVFTFEVADRGREYEFVYETPTAIREIPVDWKLGPIELK